MRKANETTHFFFGSENLFKNQEHFCNANFHYY